MSEEAKWYVIHTYSGYEKKVATTIQRTVENRGLHDVICDTLIPTEKVSESRESADGTKKQVEVERQIFPGYVLVKMVMNDATWHVVRNVRGVTSFVGPGSKPVALTEAEVASLGAESKSEPEIAFAKGDTVRITDGVFEGYFGTVNEVLADKSKVKVSLTIYGGREQIVEFVPSQLERDE